MVAQADAAHARGQSFLDAVKAVDLDEYATWLDSERIVVNLHRRFRELGPAGTPDLDQMTLLAMMAERALS